MTATTTRPAPAVPRRITPRDLDLPTYAPRVASLARKMGRPLLPWQRQTLDVALEYDPATGVLVHGDVVALAPRQAGKTTLLAPLLHHTALARPNARVYFTAQTGKDAHDWFINEHLPMLEPFAAYIKASRSAGQASVRWLHNDSLVRVFPPQRDALHGKQSDLVGLDEAWAHDALRGGELRQAIGPTQATRTTTPPGAQVWVLSAAGDHLSGFLIETLKQARASLAAGDRGPVLVEFGVPDDLDATDVDTVARYHPAVGYTIDRAHLVNERNRLGADGFARAYGCFQIIPESTILTAIDLKAWSACAWHAEIESDDVVAAFAPDISIDRSLSVIVAATVGGVIEVVESRPGTEWVTPRLIELATRWRAPIVVDKYAATSTVVDEIIRARQDRRMIVPDTNDVVTASQSFYDDVVTGAVRIRPHPDLEDAARSASTRRVGDGWCWQRRHDHAPPVAPLVAASLAWWGRNRPARVPRVA